jgi:hypothetical protein
VDGGIVRLGVPPVLSFLCTHAVLDVKAGRSIIAGTREDWRFNCPHSVFLPQMVEAGESAMAREYASLFGLPETVLVIDPAELAAEEAKRQARYLQLHVPVQNLIMVDSRWVGALVV